MSSSNNSGIRFIHRSSEYDMTQLRYEQYCRQHTHFLPGENFHDRTTPTKFPTGNIRISTTNTCINIFETIKSIQQIRVDAITKRKSRRSNLHLNQLNTQHIFFFQLQLLSAGISQSSYSCTRVDHHLTLQGQIRPVLPPREGGWEQNFRHYS